MGTLGESMGIDFENASPYKNPIISVYIYIIFFMGIVGEGNIYKYKILIIIKNI